MIWTLQSKHNSSIGYQPLAVGFTFVKNAYASTQVENTSNNMKVHNLNLELWLSSHVRVSQTKQWQKVFKYKIICIKTISKNWWQQSIWENQHW